MTQQKVVEEIFKSIEIITSKKIEETSFSLSITGKIIERIKHSDMYKVKYQNEEIRALSMGASYEQGDTVIILIPDKRIDHLKFILGRTNDRTPTITQSQAGISDAVLKEIQDALETIADIASDGVISPVEKSTLAIQWRDLQAGYLMLLEESAQYDIDTTQLTTNYQDLEDFIIPILLDMSTSSEVSGFELRDKFGKYYDEDQKTHRLILEEIAKRIGYKLELISTNGTQFTNGQISTQLIATVYRGKEDITSTLPPSSFKWKKILANGTEDLEWGVQNKDAGSELLIDGNDVTGRSTFICEIHID